MVVLRAERWDPRGRRQPGSGRFGPLAAGAAGSPERDLLGQRVRLPGGAGQSRRAAPALRRQSGRDAAAELLLAGSRPLDPRHHHARRTPRREIDSDEDIRSHSALLGEHPERAPARHTVVRRRTTIDQRSRRAISGVEVHHPVPAAGTGVRAGRAANHLPGRRGTGRVRLGVGATSIGGDIGRLLGAGSIHQCRSSVGRRRRASVDAAAATAREPSDQRARQRRRR
jgi:hypothetical protein